MSSACAQSGARRGLIVDRALLSAKLRALCLALGRARDHTPEDAPALAAKNDAQDILSLNLQRAV